MQGLTVPWDVRRQARFRKGSVFYPQGYKWDKEWSMVPAEFAPDKYRLLEETRLFELHMQCVEIRTAASGSFY